MTNRCEPPEHLCGRDGWHWVRWMSGKRQPKAWDTRWGRAPAQWNWLGGSRTPEEAAVAGWECIEPVATPEEVASLRAEIDRLRAQVASLRVSLGEMSPTEGAEPIGCPVPGMCAMVADNARLRALLRECADELAEHVCAFYAGTGHHPSQKRRFDRDMDVVNRAWVALEDKP